MRKKKYVVGLTSLILSCASAIGMSLAWFHQANTIDTGDVTGGLIKNYFHCGQGTEDNPFVITRPVHLYNFIELQKVVNGFSSAGFYFQFGYNLDGSDDGSLEFYKYDSNGLVSGEYSSSLYMGNYTDGLSPMGTAAYPFQSHFDGSGLTVSNLIINGANCLDVGIFGYVSDGTVTDLYFESPTILTSNESTAAESPSAEHVDHDTTCCYNGYLVGHLKTASLFQNVYVNNCSLDGAPSTDFIARNEYGYYGHVDDLDTTTKEKIDDLGNNDGDGDDYSFKMNASDLYGFLYEKNNSSSFDNLTMVTRNDPSAQQVTESEGLKVSSGISYSSSTFTLDGNYNDRGSTLTRNSERYNFDFAKIGYPGEAQDVEYPIYYKRGSYITVPSSAEVTSYAPDYNPTPGNYLYYDISLGGYAFYNVTTGSITGEGTDCPLYRENDDGTLTPLSGTVELTEESPDSCSAAGNYLYYDNDAGEWSYYECTTPAQAAPTQSVTFSTGSKSITSISLSGGYTNPAMTVSSTKVALYVDGEQVASTTVSATATRTSTSGNTRNGNVKYTYTLTIPSASFSTSLQEGTHYVAALATVTYTYPSRTSRNGSNTTNTGYAYAYSGTVSSSTLTGKSQEISSGTTSVTLTMDGTSTSAITYSDSRTPVIAETDSVYEDYGLKYKLNDEYYNIYDSDDSLFSSDCLTYTYYETTPAVHGDEYLVYYLKDGSYITLTERPTKSGTKWVYLGTEDGTVYLSDEFERYIPDGKTETTGYNSDNVDFIGYLDVTSTYIGMPGYTGDFYQLTTSDLGTQFYGNTVNGSSCSVVTYIKNVKTITDDSKSMGDYTVYYSIQSGESVVFARGSTSTPGSGGKTNTICTPLIDGLGGSTSTTTINGSSATCVKATVTRGNLEDCAYCAVDSGGCIVARADTSSTSGSSIKTDGGGLVYASGKTQSDIAYYVMIMSVTGGQKGSNKLFELDFEFKADEGSGGDTGDDLNINEDAPLLTYVDYRDSDETVVNSILNIQYDVPYGTSGFSVVIAYDKDSYLYTITVTNSNSDAMEFSILLNDDDGDSSTTFNYHYALIYNGVTISSSSQASKTTTLPSSS